MFLQVNVKLMLILGNSPFKAFVLKEKFDLGVDVLLYLVTRGLAPRPLLSKFLGNPRLDFSFKTFAARLRLPDHSLLLAGTHQCDRFDSFKAVFEILISPNIEVKSIKHAGVVAR